MTSWLRRWLGRPKASRSDDLVEGYEFHATLQLRTPLVALEHHGERRPVGAELPTYGPAWAGSWSLVLKSWSELLGDGSDVPDPPSEMASEIGFVPSDGGLFLPFLREYRAVVEAPEPVPRRVERLRELLFQPRYRAIASRLRPDAADWWAVDALRAAFGIGPGLARKLFDEGYREPALVSAASDAELLAIPGLGEKSLAKVRAARSGRKS